MCFHVLLFTFYSTKHVSTTVSSQLFKNRPGPRYALNHPGPPVPPVAPLFPWPPGDSGLPCGCHRPVAIGGTEEEAATALAVVAGHSGGRARPVFSAGGAWLSMEKEILPLKPDDLFRAGDNYQHHGWQLPKYPLLIKGRYPLHQL